MKTVLVADDEVTIQKLYEHSEGSPREATILADNSLLLAYLRKQKRVGAELVAAAADERKANLSGARKEAA